MNVTEIWKLKKKLWPKKKSALPVAKRNLNGKLVSAPADLRNLQLKEYKERLRPRPSHTNLKQTKILRNKLIQMKLNLANTNKSEPFEMNDLEKV